MGLRSCEMASAVRDDGLSVGPSEFCSAREERMMADANSVLVPPCVFRDLSDEAWRVSATTGQAVRCEVWLCSWPTTLGARPRWVERSIGAGLAIDPARDCVGCPVRRDR